MKPVKLINDIQERISNLVSQYDEAVSNAKACKNIMAKRQFHRMSATLKEQIKQLKKQIYE